MSKRLKKTASLALAMLLLLALLPGGALAAVEVATGTCGADGSNLTWTLDSAGVMTISGTGEIASYESETATPWAELRDSIRQLKIESGVTVIGNNAFNNCTVLESVSFPDTLMYIGWSAFFHCYALTEVKIPASVTWIADDAFAYCSGVQQYIVEEGNPAYRVSIGGLTTLDYTTFIVYPSGSTQYTGVRLSIYTKTINNYAFAYASSLQDIKLPAGITSIPFAAFYACTGLREVFIPASVTEIAAYAFAECSALTDIYFGGTAAQWQSITVEEYNDPFHNANVHCVDDLNEIADTGLTWSIDSSGTMTISGSGEIPNYDDTFYGLSPWYDARNSIKNLVLSSGVTSIGEFAFYRCEELTSVSLPNGLQSIKYGAFAYCPKLTSISIPKTVTEYESEAILGCVELSSVTVEAGNPVYHSNGNCLIETAEKRLVLGSSNGIIPADGSVTSIGDYAYSLSNLTSITIPGTVTSIGEGAFFACEDLSSVVIPTSVQRIDDYAFMYCSALTEIAIPEGVPGIGKGALYDCESLTRVNIPASVQTIGEWAFDGCTALKDVYYGGDSAAWSAIEIADHNDPLTSAQFHFVETVKITTQPQNATVAEGGTATFKVVASGQNLSYQWQVSTNGGSTWSNSPATGSKTATLTVPATMSRNGYKYRCVVKSGSDSVTSSAATLTVTAPKITAQPKSVTASAGSYVQFSVTATGSNLTYQWQVSTDGGSTWSNSPAEGNKTAALTVPVTASRNGYKYRCIVKSGTASVTSSAATLTVS